MSAHYEGKLNIKDNELNLDLTLLGGQSFRWEKVDTEWRGVACDAYWVLTQNASAVQYKVHPCTTKLTSDKTLPHHDANFYEALLKRYFRVDFDLNANVEAWKTAHTHFAEIGANMKAVRVLDQEPLENILSFICSQNNHIKRISTMIQWLCSKYGKEIGTFNNKCAEFTFPSLEALLQHQKGLDSALRTAKFGYRAKFIAQTVSKIAEFGGEKWFSHLRKLSYCEARLELVKLPGIGFKVADCICLMSLGHLESVPIDTHIFKIAQTKYMPELAKVKSVTPKIYEEISTHFRDVYGPYAGWTQAVLFCSELQKFQTKLDEKMENGKSETAKSSASKKKRK